MSKLQEVFIRMEETKKKIKEIKAMYREALANSKSYQELAEEYKTMKEKKKKLEDSYKDEFRGEFDQLEVLKTDLANDTIMLSDMAMAEYTKGAHVEVVDSKNYQYEPIFVVRFKKAGTMANEGQPHPERSERPVKSNSEDDDSFFDTH